MRPSIQAVRFYKIPPEHVIVVSDEISLPIGKLRIRVKGSAGGHNGLKTSSPSSVPTLSRASASASARPRTRTMIWLTGCSPHSRIRTPSICCDAALRAAHAAECYITDGADRAMNRFN